MEIALPLAPEMALLESGILINSTYRSPCQQVWGVSSSNTALMEKYSSPQMKSKYGFGTQLMANRLELSWNTILTSLDRADLDNCLLQPGDIKDLVITRAAKAFEAGADGVIASPQEAALIRALPEAEEKLIVTPGVRPAGADLDDQKRVATPAHAISNGADHIVVGRPIWQADDPRAAAEAIVAELNS